MPKKALELGSLQVSRLAAPGLHSIGGVAGLQLQVSQSGARSWVLRVRVGGRRRDMGLGGYPDVTLAGAREAARAARATIAAGVDPIERGQAARVALVASRAAERTFEHCARAYVDLKSAEWKNPKHIEQWQATLGTYAYPHIGSMPVREVALPNIMAVLEPIWTTKTETASRLRGRLERVLDWATTSGYREGPNPARWRGHLDNLLGSPKKVAKVEHHQALPAAAVGVFMAELRGQDGYGAKALEFAILTAARSGEVRGATWAEIDFDQAVWNVPAERMKMKKPHRVPLSAPALELLRNLPRIVGVKLIFPAPRGGALSDMTLTAVLRRMEVPAVPHGFRSTFRDWCSEQTNHTREVAEMALAHAIGDKVEAAYRRGDLFKKRRRLMDDWAAFCGKVPAAKAAALRGRRA